MPRRSSTRTSRTVSSPTRAAPGLKTELAGYGTWSAVMIGLRRMAREQVGGVGTPSRVSLGWSRIGDDRRSAAGGHRRRVADRARIVADALERGQPHQRRLGALVAVDAGRRRGRRSRRPATGSAIGSAEVVVAQEPAVGPLDRVEVARVAGRGARRDLGREDQRRRLDRLLVEPGPFAAARPPAVVPIGEKCPSGDVWTSISQSRTRRPVRISASSSVCWPATIRARGRSGSRRSGPAPATASRGASRSTRRRVRSRTVNRRSVSLGAARSESSRSSDSSAAAQPEERGRDRAQRRQARRTRAGRRRTAGAPWRRSHRRSRTPSAPPSASIARP